MPKVQPAAAHFATGHRSQTAFREVCVPLYLPAIEAWELSAPHEIDLEDLVVDASGITIGGDEDDDDLY